MRAFDEACLEALRRGEIHGELHTGINQEAIGAAMAESLRPGDAVVSTHRNHFHALAKGVPARALLAEILERETGLCRGRGGHMHPFHPPTNFSATGIVGASLPVALGYAQAFRLRGEDHVAVGVTGDGGSHTGAFHETLVIAGARRLPLVVLVENNALAISVGFGDVSPTATVAERAGAWGARGMLVDGTDVDATAEAFAAAMEQARGGGGPVLLEATCTRARGHFEGDPDTYRTREEKRRLREERDPIALHRARLLAEGVGADALDRMAAEVRAETARLLEAVRADPLPDPAGAALYLWAEEA
nr:thiamine pyrophosphate-dependent dehydrogenase E1 component subunit alpha [Rubellimicrobium sp. CFH 75288]